METYRPDTLLKMRGLLVPRDNQGENSHPDCRATSWTFPKVGWQGS